MTRATLRTGALFAAVAVAGVSSKACGATAAPSVAERAFARGVAHETANRLTANLAGNTGRHVALDCVVMSVVRADAMIGNCGTAAEPVDFYVETPTPGLRPGDRLHVLGEMQTPPFWVDATGHTWYTALVRAVYAHRL